MNLADHYRSVNLRSGHASNCAFGAGADCSCRISTEHGASDPDSDFVRAARSHYRAIRSESDLPANVFDRAAKNVVRRLIENGSVSGRVEIASAFVDVARIIVKG